MTIAIRTLLAKHGLGLTYSQARPMLEKSDGVTVVPEPPTRSEGLSAIEAAYKERDGKVPPPTLLVDAEAIKKICAKLRIEATPALIKECHAVGLYRTEVNAFNVTKNNFKKKGGNVSLKPSHEKNAKAHAAVKAGAKVVGRRGRKPAVVMDLLDDNAALDLVEEVGGVSAANDKIESMKAEIARLESAVEVVVAQSKRYAKVA